LAKYQKNKKVSMSKLQGNVWNWVKKSQITSPLDRFKLTKKDGGGNLEGGDERYNEI
jgi:hypothetical protein